MEKSLKVVVAHPYQQHSYNLAIAMKKKGILYKYVTTVYDTKKSYLLQIVKKFMSEQNRRKAEHKKCSYLVDEEVVLIDELKGLISLILLHIPQLAKISQWFSQKLMDDFGVKLAKYAIKHQVDAVILCDVTSNTCFEYLKTNAPNIKRILDYTALNPFYVRSIYFYDMELLPEIRPKLSREIQNICTDEALKLVQQELINTQFYLVSSVLTKKSLMYSQIEENSIYVCHQGTHLEINRIKRKFLPNKPLNAVYVGNVMEKKGIFHLLRVIKRFSENDIELTCVGAYDNTDKHFSSYFNRVTFTGRVIHNDVIKYLCEADVFIFPSLGDGYGNAPIEAMAYGVPCIVSANTGMKDYIVDYRNGFVVPVFDEQILFDRLQWCIEHREQLYNMRDEVYKTVEKITWRAYNFSVKKAMEDIFYNTIKCNSSAQ